jgi:ABC-type glycerol-3-phosphate transport system permease component
MSSERPRSILRNSISESEECRTFTAQPLLAQQHLRFINEPHPYRAHRRRFWESTAIAIAAVVILILVLFFGGWAIVSIRNKWGQGSWPGGPL